MVRLSTCRSCGARQPELSKVRRKDFPRSVHVIVCAKCGSLIGVSNLYDAVDALRRGDTTERRLAEEILSEEESGS